MEFVQHDPSLLAGTNLRLQNNRLVRDGASVSACCRLRQGLANLALCAVVWSLVPDECWVLQVAAGRPWAELMRLHMVSNCEILRDVLHSFACVSQLVAYDDLAACQFTCLVAEVGGSRHLHLHQSGLLLVLETVESSLPCREAQYLGDVLDIGSCLNLWLLGVLFDLVLEVLDPWT